MIVLLRVCCIVLLVLELACWRASASRCSIVTILEVRVLKSETYGDAFEWDYYPERTYMCTSCKKNGVRVVGSERMPVKATKSDGTWDSN